MAYKKEYKSAEYSKRADKNYKAKIMAIRFGLNLEQTEKAKRLESPNKIAKRLFLDYLNGIE